MRAFFRFTALCGLLLLIGTSAFAQGTTATLTGTVTQDGAPLPGVTVTITSPAMQGTKTTVTSDNGGYLFPALPPGMYTVTFEMSGMQTITEKSPVSLSQTTRVNAEMRLSAVAEAITVTASAPAVLESPQIARTFTRAEMDELPVARTIISAVNLSPGVNSGIAGPSISGAASSENVYLVNGVQVNENLRGQPHDLFIEDAIQETTVLTGGISAEYGRFTGGVISTVTKSGGNEFSGSFRDSLTNADWQKKTPWPTEADHIDDIGEVYEGTLGGFIMRDRLWFFAAGRQVETTSQAFTSITNIPFGRGTEETRMEGKLTAQITPKYSIVGSYIDVDRVQKNNTFGTIMDLRSLDVERSLPNTLGTIVFNGVITTNWFVEANYGKKEFAFVGSGADSTDRIEGTLMLDTSGRRYWSPTFCGVCTDEERNNDAYLAKTTYYLSSRSLGSHTIVGGYENYAEERIVNNHQSGSNFRITASTVIVNGTPTPRFDSATRITWNPIFKFSEGTDFQTNGLFVNDRWDLNDRLSFNVGVRFDKNDGKDADGNIVANDSEFSPRLGAQFD
ncbi:MAG TPA: TonB-dependent receptor, partial [Thermoanaerobaculia bacterium]